MSTEAAHEHECVIRIRNHDEYVDASCIPEGGWGVVVHRGFCVRPPGTPIALPLAAHNISFNADFPGSVTVTPSIDYDKGGPWAWHGHLIASQWIPAPVSSPVETQPCSNTTQEVTQ